VALIDPKDTLAFHQSRVLAQHLDRSGVPCVLVSNAMTAFEKLGTPDASPEGEALWFYAMNHGVAMIAAGRAPLEPLPAWELSFVDAYYTLLNEKAVRAFYYLVRICTREARHNQSLATSITAMKPLFGEAVATFFEKVNGGEGGIASKFKTSPPNATIGQFVKALQWQFYHAKWSGGYGGKKWGAVTDCLVRFVTGEFSAEMMLDTVWTLAHNNGPIFNKGYLYQMYSPTIYRLLDVQRSGQIPTACLKDSQLMKFTPGALQGWMQGLAKNYPDAVKGYVDWEIVEALGAVHKYPQDKAAQQKLHGMSPAAKAAQAEAKLKAEKMEAEAAQKAADHAKNWFQVMPGLEVEKVTIKRAA